LCIFKKGKNGDGRDQRREGKQAKAKIAPPSCLVGGAVGTDFEGTKEGRLAGAYLN
jgi:hypothetical protein